MILMTLTFSVMNSVARPQHVQAPGDEARIMRAGNWEGQYTDLNGHQGRLRFTISKTGGVIEGHFELVLRTEDKPERYQGTVAGTAQGDQLVLKLHFTGEVTMICRLILRQPATYAEQAAFGIVEPVSSLNFGGGTLMAWKFRRDR
jgi:hypothetical protein